MKKLVLCLLASLLCLLTVLVAAVLTSPMWAGPLVRSVANAKVPQMSGTGFSVGSCDIGVFSGKCSFENMKLENPDGFSERVALSFDSLAVDVDVPSLNTDRIHVREIVLDGLFVSYLDGQDGTNNFKAIGSNFSRATGNGGSEDASGPSADASDGTKGGEDKRKRVVIDRIDISNAKIRVGGLPLPIPLPKITLRDIGKDSDGINYAELWNTVSEELLKSCGVIGSGLESLGNASVKFGKSGISGGTNTIMKAAEAFKTIGSGSAESIKDGVDSLLNLFKDGKKRK